VNNSGRADDADDDHWKDAMFWVSYPKKPDMRLYSGTRTVILGFGFVTLMSAITTKLFIFPCEGK
jgi:hypothetical protein